MYDNPKKNKHGKPTNAVLLIMSNSFSRHASEHWTILQILFCISFASLLDHRYWSFLLACFMLIQHAHANRHLAYFIPLSSAPRGTHLWEFIRDILIHPEKNQGLMKWEDRREGVFKFLKSEAVAQMWGQKKKNSSMTYEKLSRAMRWVLAVTAVTASSHLRYFLDTLTMNQTLAQLIRVALDT